MNPEITVIICTHNPRQDYLERTLEGMRAQQMPHTQWELLVVDNASTEPVAERFDIGWHPGGKVVVEAELGLTPARRRGIAEAQAPLIVFSDDDNILAPNYLEKALELGRHYSVLGAWGGQQFPEFEREPDEDVKPYTRCLALRQFERDYWGNIRDYGYQPWGAGMVIRKHVAEQWSANLETSAARLGLGRKGASLTSGEDLDMAMTSHELGLGTGLFQALTLTHLIPERRVDRAYLLKLWENIHYSEPLLRDAREPGGFIPPYPSPVDRLVAGYKRLRLPKTIAAFERAAVRGRDRARDHLSRQRGTAPEAV